MHADIKDGTIESCGLGSIVVLGGSCDLSGVQGSGFRVPYLRGHSANGGQVIPSAQEVWSVDLQLKVAQPLDNGL